jgi:hypothetical protein
MVLVVAFFSGYSLFIFENTSTLTKMYLHELLPLGSGPNKSTETNSPTSVAITGRKLVIAGVKRILFCWHKMHVETYRFVIFFNP